jgi:hypothetical protein
MRRLVGLGGIALAAGWLILTAGPGWAQSPSGNVTATVQVQASACITISPTSFTYPPSGFNSGGSPAILVPTGNIPVVTSCSTGTQDYLAKGGNATGASATWQLTALVDCTGAQADLYRHQVLGTGPSISLSTTDQTWEDDVPAGAMRNLAGRLTMPCTGSSGAGVTMSLPITVTAVVQ